MSDRALRIRSLLFVPGSRPDMVAKLPRFAPDVAVVDLEDAVAAADKDRARELTVRAVADLADSAEADSADADSAEAGAAARPAEGARAAEGRPAMRVLVRINPVGSPWFEADLAAVAAGRADGAILPKAERAADVERVRAALGASAIVLAGIESARGVADAREILQPATTCYFGAEDYIADLGGRRSAANTEVLHARSQVVLAARLAAIPAVDQAVMALDDPERFAADAAQGVDLGYQGKICIHPRQVALAHAAFTPGEDEVAHARAVLAAGAGGVGTLDGQMIDDVHLKLARAVLTRAGGA